MAAPARARRVNNAPGDRLRVDRAYDKWTRKRTKRRWLWVDFGRRLWTTKSANLFPFNALQNSLELCRTCVERVMGIEPTLSGWEPEVLPLNYTRPDVSPSGEVRIQGPGIVHPLRGLDNHPEIGRRWLHRRLSLREPVYSPS
jgi:hypothetical protein